MKIRFLFIVSVVFCLLNLTHAWAQNVKTSNVQSLNVDQTNQAKTASGNSDLDIQKAAAEARKQGASEAQIQQMIKRMELEYSEKKKRTELWLTDMAKEPVKDEITIHRSRSLGFQNESKKSEVKITMTNEYNYLGISIRSKFIKGTLVVEIFDPKGDKQGSYTLKTEETVVLGENTISGEQVSGEFDKYFKFPINGEWIIRAVPTSATGTIELVLIQKYIKRTDTF